jgi:hypothetical protein
MAATETILLPVAASAGAKGGVLATPFQYLLTGVETFKFVSFSDDPNAQWEIGGRMLNAAGTITPFDFIVPQVLTALHATILRVGAGALLTLTVRVRLSSTNPMWGRHWAQVQLQQGEGVAATILGTLVQSYVTGNLPAAWPGTAITAPVDGTGIPVRLTGALPAQGAAAVVPIDPVAADARVQYVTISVGMTTSVAAGARRPVLRWPSGPNSWCRMPACATFGPSVTFSCTWGLGLSAVDASAQLACSQGLPDKLFAEFADAQTAPTIQVVGIDAADQIGAIEVTTMRWVDPRQ